MYFVIHMAFLFCSLVTPMKYIVFQIDMLLTMELVNSYFWLTEMLSFIFPVISLLIMNSVIIYTLRVSNRSKLDLLKGTGKGDRTEAQILKAKHSEKQITTTLLLVTFVFVILNIPVRSVVYFVNFTSWKDIGLFELFEQIGVKAYFTNHCINFFLYVTSGQKFRKDLKTLFCSKVHS